MDELLNVIQYINAWLTLAKSRFYQYKIEKANALRRLKAISLLATAIGALFFVGKIQHREGLRMMSLQLLPATLMFFLWLQMVEKESHRLYRHAPSLLVCCVTLACFVVIAAFGYNDVGYWAAIMGGLVSLFVWVDPFKFYPHVVRDPRLAAVALIGAATTTGYFTVQTYLWRKMCNATAQLIDFILNLSPLDVWSYEKINKKAIVISTEYYSINLSQPCSGLEGIFLFIFLLSALIIIDWRLFKRLRLLDIYLIGFLYMFFVNALRIIFFFLVGNWAWANDYDLAVSMRRTPLMLFHSWIGWTVYLLAFWIFITCLYKYIARQQSRAHANTADDSLTAI